MTSRPSQTTASLLCALALACAVFPGHADMPARAVDYVDIAALRALALDYFGPCQAATLGAALERAMDPACPAHADMPRHACARGNHGALGAIAGLIGDAGRAKTPLVSEFLARVNEAKLVRGVLIARHGGEHDTQFALEIEPDGRRILVARHLYKDGRSAAWRLPIARVADTRPQGD